MRRFGITGRLVAIGLVGFLALLTLFGALIYQVRTQESVLARAFPAPERVAAIVAALDAMPREGRANLLASLNAPGLSVAVAADRPADDGMRRPLAEAYLRTLPPLQDREVRVISEGAGAFVADPERWISGAPLAVVAGLAGGDVVVIRVRGALLPRLAGIPTGFWLAAASLLIAGFTLAALVRETRPLRDLTAALARFSESATPARVKPEGAADVRGLIETVNTMQERIGALVKGRTILAGAISHDLRTWLTRLQLRVEDIPDAAERAAAEADIAAMLAIVENAMTFAKSAVPDRAPVDLRALAREEIAHQPDAIDLTGDEAVTVGGDATALRRVIGNLIENARRHADTVTVTIGADSHTATLTVDDDGPGIPEAEREAVFEPFYRLDPSRSAATGGSGLGLALCRQIVEAHGGRIRIDAAPTGGTRVRVTLPAHDQENETASGNARAVSAQTETG